MSYVDVFRPKSKSWAYSFDLLAVFAGSLFLALMSQLSINLWFTPVPLTMQTFGILMMGSLLGSKRGVLAVLLYLAEGALGLPFFAGGHFGLAYLLGSTGGYFLGFILSTFLIGYLLERGWKQNYMKTLIALTLGSCLILGCGVLWLASLIGASKALKLGLYPFLIGDLLKLGMAAALIPTGWKFLK